MLPFVAFAVINEKKHSTSAFFIRGKIIRNNQIND